jgi:hypothetical protein
MDTLDHWRILDKLTVVQAAYLIVGRDPSKAKNAFDEFIVGLDPVMTALQNDIRDKLLSASIVESQDIDASIYINWDKTMISVKDLKPWLTSRAVTTGFFFPEPVAQPQAGQARSIPDYLSPQHPCYSAKLAAAIAAWKAVSSDVKLTRNKSVKQAILEWLGKNYVDLGLIKKDGKQNKEAIEEIAKVANWDTKGGAPKTAGND